MLNYEHKNEILRKYTLNEQISMSETKINGGVSFDLMEFLHVRVFSSRIEKSGQAEVVKLAGKGSAQSLTATGSHVLDLWGHELGGTGHRRHLRHSRGFRPEAQTKILGYKLYKY